MTAINDYFILCVDDDSEDLEMLQEALEEVAPHISILKAGDGEEALLLLQEMKEISRLPSLVVLDINMPKVNGLDVLARLRADPRTSLLPVVMLTSSAEERDLVAAYLNHANSYIRKPVDFDQFTHAVQQLGLYWLVLNQPPPRPTPAPPAD